MFHMAAMWVIGGIISVADLFGTIIRLAEVWIKGALSTAVILLAVAVRWTPNVRQPEPCLKV
jgi:hypothetical protein